MRLCNIKQTHDPEQVVKEMMIMIMILNGWAEYVCNDRKRWQWQDNDDGERSNALRRGDVTFERESYDDR